MVAPLAGRTGDRAADRGDRGGGAGRQRAGPLRRPPRRRRRRPSAGGRHRHRAGRLTVDAAGHRIRQGPRRFCNRSPRRSARTPTSRSSRSWRPTGPASPTPTRPRSAGTTSAPSNRRCAVRRSPRCTPARSVRRSGRSRRCATTPAARRAGVGGHPQQSLADRWRAQWPTIAAVSVARAGRRRWSGCGRSGAGCCGRPTGCAPDELRVMYEHHDAILHSVSEGLIVLDRNGVALANDEARRLLALPPGPGRPLGSAGVPAHLRPGRARRGARHRRPGAGGQPLPGGGWAARLRSRHHP